MLGTDQGGYREVGFYYNDANQPGAYTNAQYRARVKNSLINWDWIENPCGIDSVSSIPNYFLDCKGITTATSGVSADFNTCAAKPTVNVVDWKYSSIATNRLAVTCTWFANGTPQPTSGNQINRRHLWFADSNINNCAGTGRT